MATKVEQTISGQIRDVTDDEVREYREQGWVELKRLVDPELAGELLSHIKRQTGLEYDELPRITRMPRPSSSAFVKPTVASFRCCA